MPNAVAAMMLGEIDGNPKRCLHRNRRILAGVRTARKWPHRKGRPPRGSRKVGQRLAPACMAAKKDSARPSWRPTTEPFPHQANCASRIRLRATKMQRRYSILSSAARPERRSLAAYRGKVVAFSFWATWCSPCRVVEPIFDQVAKGYAGNAKVEFLAVNTDEDRTVVAPFMAREKWTLPIAYADGLDALLESGNAAHHHRVRCLGKNRLPHQWPRPARLWLCSVSHERHRYGAILQH